MILDHIQNYGSYAKLHPLFPAAFAHLLALSTCDGLPTGRIELDGECIYAMVTNGTGKPRDKARTETHRRYIDIQYTLTGTDLIGWLPASDCAHSIGYDASKDIEFYTDWPEVWFEVKAGQFAVFFSHDAHAPMANEGKPISKIVIKVAV